MMIVKTELVQIHMRFLSEIPCSRGVEIFYAIGQNGVTAITKVSPTFEEHLTTQAYCGKLFQ